MPGYDYGQEGCYFVTVCTANKQPLFGTIIKHQVRLNEFGLIVKQEWLKTRLIRHNFQLGKYVIMPDHFHAIVRITRKIGNTVWAAGRPPDKKTIDGRYMDGARRIGVAPPDEKTPGWPYPAGARRAPLQQQIRPRSLSSFVAGFKAAVTARINISRGTSGEPIWQRNYYEHIIRTDRELARLEDYIKCNPMMADK